jgi:iron(III) transport system substrate-binding protein
MRKTNGFLLFLVITVFLVSPLWAASRQESPAGAPAVTPATRDLLVYSIINEEETKALAELFTKQTGVRVSYIRAATGELINRVIAEKNAPQADIVLGGAESLHIAVARSGALLPYHSPEAADFPAYSRAADGSWTGFCLLTLGIGINEQRFKEKFSEKAYPATWDALNDPAFKGELIFTDPTASQTGYLFLQSQLQRLGADAGWDYFRRLTPLAAQLPSSGNAPPRLVGTGEYTIGVAYVHALEIYTAQGFPVKIVIPPKTVGEIDAVSIIAGGPNTENARRFVDFMLAPEAQELFCSLSRTIPVNPRVKPSGSTVSIEKIDLLDFDSERAGAERDAVLSLWRQRF